MFGVIPTPSTNYLHAEVTDFSLNKEVLAAQLSKSVQQAPDNQAVSSEVVTVLNVLGRLGN